MIVNNIDDNEYIKGIIRAYDLDTPKYMVGDKISFRKNAEKIFIEKIFTAIWDSSYEEFLNLDSITIISKFRANEDTPWWSLVADGTGSEIFIIDDCLTNPCIPAKIMYSSKKIKKTI